MSESGLRMHKGTMFTYYKDPYCKIPVFMMGMEASRCVLWMGGQTESFFSFDYFPRLVETIGNDWGFVQVEIPSGRIGSGAQDHVREAEDVDDLISILVKKHGMTEVALFATGTGSQLVFELLDNSINKEFITRVILHGVVCDPSSPLFTEEGCAERLELVQRLVADGRGEDSRAVADHYDIPITPARLASGGFPTLQEAVWSPCIRRDYAVLQRSLGVVKVPLLLMLAHHAQYKPTEEDVELVLQCVKEYTACARVTVSYFNDTCDERRRVLKAAEYEHVLAIAQFLMDEDEYRNEQRATERLKAIEDERKRSSILQLSAFGQTVSTS
ncbi:putative Protein of unknown function (DUF1749) [Trypanosoma vivax]|nr:hypothetical protein TRVL_00410 [Trypanosoma vivax]KAH8620712.1 putative Protein of unknown function (DUF1749) [Trypanosoma vivax]